MERPLEELMGTPAGDRDTLVFFLVSDSFCLFSFHFCVS